MMREQGGIVQGVFSRLRNEGGAIIIFVAVGLVVLIGMMGLAFDLGHAYVNKSQLQNIADASALAGASALNGKPDGIDEAERRATDVGSLKLENTTEFNKVAVTIPPGNVKYLKRLDGKLLTKEEARDDPSEIRFVRVEVPSQPTTVYFARVVPGIGNVMNFGAQAVAGQEPLTEVCQGLDPFSPAVIPDQVGECPPFGYCPGRIYTLRLSPGGSEKNCSEYGLPGGVTGNYGIADPANCGPNVPCFESTLLGGAYSNCIPIGDDSLPTNPGVMAVPILKAMNERFEQDSNQDQYTSLDPYSEFLNDYLPSKPNRRRIIRVAFNDLEIPGGHSGNYNIDGFGCFFMPVLMDKKLTSDAICLLYIGPCDESGNPTGGNSPSITKIVLFR